jgi:hypothetical protein
MTSGWIIDTASRVCTRSLGARCTTNGDMSRRAKYKPKHESGVERSVRGVRKMREKIEREYYGLTLAIALSLLAWLLVVIALAV